MENVCDITGWREELAVFKNSREGQSYFGKYFPSSSVRAPKLPYKTVLLLGELILKHDEPHEALKEHMAWHAFADDIVDMSPDHPEWDRNPFDAHKTLMDFKEWFGMKTRCPYNSFALGHGKDLASYVEEGRFSDLSSPDLELHAREVYATFITFEKDESDK